MRAWRFRTADQLGLELLDLCNQVLGPDHDVSQQVASAVQWLRFCQGDLDAANAKFNPIRRLDIDIHELQSSGTSPPRIRSRVERLFNQRFEREINEVLAAAAPASDSD